MCLALIQVMNIATLIARRTRLAPTAFHAIWTLYFLLGIVRVGSAAQVPEPVTRAVALHFLRGEASSFAGLRSEALVLVHEAGEPGFGTTEARTFYRVYNAAGHGFVVVAADDLVLPVLAWSEEGPFDPDQLPVNAAKWFEGYVREMRYVLDEAPMPDAEVDQTWQRLLVDQLVADRADRDVAPLLQTKWDQAPHVNAQCPGGSVTGCVATAMAQIMKYHAYPQQGVGFHSYNAPNHGTLSANFGATTYNWGAMPNIVNSANNAVATLMYHCGVSVDMQYSPQVSNAYLLSNASPIQHCAEYAMRTYFNYSSDMQGVHRDQNSEAQWISLMKGELDASRPVLYAGFGSGGGHAFVCDGYNSNNFFHFNWGWGGQADGYFQVGALNPGSTGTGGGSGGYNSGQQALIGLRPPTGGGGGGGTGQQTFDMRLYTFVTPSASTIYYGQGFSVSTNIVNNGTTNFSGDYCAAVFDANNNFYGYVQTLTGYALQGGYVYNNNLVFNTSGLLTMLPGTYYVGVFYRPTGGEWVLVANNGSYTNFPQINVVNPNAIELNAAMTVSPGTTLTQGGQVSVNLNIINTGASPFYGQYGVGLYNLDGTWAQDIGVLNETNGLPYGYTYLSPFLTFGPAQVTVQPGTYLLATQHNPNNSGWQLTGSTYHANPIFVNVVAAGLSPDQYEVNNNVGQAYALPVNFSGNSASTSTAGSNLHTTSDQDFYKVVLPAGNNYAITARLHDSYNSGNGTTYSVDGVFSVSGNGSTWSAVYDDMGPGNIIVNGGGTVYFHVAPYFAGETGTYLLQLDIVRGADVSVGEHGATAGIRIFPNPAQDQLMVDLSAFEGRLQHLQVFGLQGQLLLEPALASRIDGPNVVDLSSLADGAYVVRLITDKGIRSERIIVAR